MGVELFKIYDYTFIILYITQLLDCVLYNYEFMIYSEWSSFKYLKDINNI